MAKAQCYDCWRTESTCDRHYVEEFIDQETAEDDALEDSPTFRAFRRISTTASIEAIEAGYAAMEAEYRDPNYVEDNDDLEDAF
jgi:hypothetical protein